jgi:hypothetical protein
MAVRAIIQSQIQTHSIDQVKEEEMPQNKEEAENDSANDEEMYGPKTAEMPDPTIYPSDSDKMEELLDVGDLPPHLHERAWEMLKSHVAAFGFDGN